MKKLLFFAAMMLGLASCQTEPEGLGVDMGAQETNITVALPETTRANSALSGLDNGVLADHDLRFILEIYSDGGDECLREEQIAADGVTSTSFNVRLVPGHAYEFVVWADFVKNGVDTYFDTTNGLDAIEMSNLNAMTEARDAYYGVASIAEGGSVSEVSTIVLKRPFAKVRVVADDVEEAKEALQKGLTTATATYDADVIVYDTFDARNKIVSGDANKVKNIDYPSAYDESNLYVDYLLVPQNEPSVIKFDLNVAGFVNRSFNTDIAVEANKLTTIKGNILTNGSDINVEIEDNFAAETIYLEGDVTLTENLVIDRPMVVRAGAKAVLNLNGHNIINNTKSETFGEGEGIIAYGELDIIGEGTVQGSTMAVWARGNAGAVVNIYGGTFLGCEEGFAKGGRSVVYASSDNVVNIYGGEVKSLAADKTSYANKTEGVFAALNVADRHGVINVYGGSFYKQNPAVPGTEPSDWNATHPNGFLAEGYVSVANGEWFDVIYDPYYGYTKVSTVDDLNKAFTDNTVEKIYLAAGEYDLNDQIYYLTSKKELVSDAAIKPVVKGKFVADTKDFTATNIKFGRNSQSDKMLDKGIYGTYVVDNYNAIITLNYAAGTFEGCEFDGEDEIVAINYFQDAAGKVLNVNNCTFTNTFIYSKVLCNITNNTFNLGSEVPYPICVWPRPAGSTNSICYFVNNTLNSTYFPTENLAYCQVMLLSQSAPYANLEFNIQGNSGSKYTVGWTNSVAFKNDGSVTFADGSKTFNFPKLVD